MFESRNKQDLWRYENDDWEIENYDLEDENDDWEIVNVEKVIIESPPPPPLPNRITNVPDVLDESELIDETKADIILKSPIENSYKKIEVLKFQSPNEIVPNIIKNKLNKTIKYSIKYLFLSEKFWFNASIITMKCCENIDWRINCICLSVNAGIIIYKNRKIITNLRKIM